VEREPLNAEEYENVMKLVRGNEKIEC